MLDARHGGQAGYWISGECDALFIDRVSSIQYPLVQSRGDPFHLWPVRRGFLGDDDVTAVWKHSPKSIQHSIYAADNLTIECGIRLIEPTGQADSARHRIDFSDDITFVG